jgi:hypothetical protein
MRRKPQSGQECAAADAGNLLIRWEPVAGLPSTYVGRTLTRAANWGLKRVRLIVPMVWFYERSDGALRIETRFDSATKEYILEVAWPGRSPTMERFSSSVAFETRVLALEGQLATEHWQQVGSPEILPHGWRGAVTH